MARRTLSNAVVGGLVIAAVGCGGSKPLTRAEFVKRADAVCQHASAKFAANLKKGSAHAESAAAFRAAFKQDLHDMVSGLEAIHAPKDLETTYAKFTAARSDEVDAMISRAAGASNVDARQEKATHAATALKGKLGLRIC